MGQIRIDIGGSFGERQETFSALDHGHADAVAQAIEFLASVVLPWATRLDHRLHDEGDGPRSGWHRPPATSEEKKP